MHYIIGIDEAGRGSWAGPVVAGGWMCDIASASVILDSFTGLTDSKLLSPEKREILLQKIHASTKIGKCFSTFAKRESEDIDRFGIREANRLAMEAALKKLLTYTNSDDTLEIYIDGCDNYRFDLGEISIGYEFQKPKSKKISDSESQYQKKIQVIYKIGGDRIIGAISAASIIAKVSRDRIMCDFSVEYSNYGFHLHKGYGTKRHQEALLHYGITPLHRKSYAPVKRLILEHS